MAVSVPTSASSLAPESVAAGCGPPQAKSAMPIVMTLWLIASHLRFAKTFDIFTPLFPVSSRRCPPSSTVCADSLRGRSPDQMPIQRTNHDRRSTDHDLRLTDHGRRPTDHDLRPTDHDLRPTDHVLRPTDHDRQPTNQPLQRPSAGSARKRATCALSRSVRGAVCLRRRARRRGVPKPDQSNARPSAAPKSLPIAANLKPNATLTAISTNNIQRGPRRGTIASCRVQSG